ncbi:MAG: SxtJ family membrane protein [Pirellulales bacterium]
MKLTDIQWQPSDRQLRQFAVIALVALPVIGWLWGASWSCVSGLAAVGALLAAVGLQWPQRLRYLFIGMSVAAVPIGLVVGEVAMLLVYFAVLAPIAMMLRVAGRDRLQLRGDAARQSYWEEKPREASSESYFRQW